MIENRKNWVFSGLFWAALMLVFWFGYGFLDGTDITLRYVLAGVVLWSVMGLIWGYLVIKPGGNNTPS